MEKVKGLPSWMCIIDDSMIIDTRRIDCVSRTDHKVLIIFAGNSLPLSIDRGTVDQAIQMVTVLKTSMALN